MFEAGKALQFRLWHVLRIAPNQPTEPVRLHGLGYGLECPWRSFHTSEGAALDSFDIRLLGGAETEWDSRGYHDPGDNHGTHSFPLLALISHANFDGLLGITHTQKIFVSSPDLGAVFEVAESLKRGSRFVRRDACRVPAVKPM